MISQPRRGLHKQIVDELGLQIIGGQLSAGDTLPSADILSDELGVSRTVTREAIKVLEEKGLLTSRPKAGIQVLPPSNWKHLDADVLKWQHHTSDSTAFWQNLIQVRRIIEPEASRLAAQHATPEELGAIHRAYQKLAQSVHNLDAYKAADQAFHSLIFTATRNPLLAYIGNTVNIDLDAGRDVTARVPRSLAESLPLHAQLDDALQNRQAEIAYEITVQLVDQIAAFIQEALTE